MPASIRLGLCCQFRDQPIRFRTTTIRHLAGLGPLAGYAYRDDLIIHNFLALNEAIACCAQLGIHAFRISSQIIPAATHPDWLFDLEELHGAPRFADLVNNCRATAASLDVRLSMHPDQFVVLSSPSEKVVVASLAELEYQAAVCTAVGADVLNIHGGGAYGDKAAALHRFTVNADRLSPAARCRLTIENDDRTYTPADLLPLCQKTGIPLVYDVHHHRCHPDDLTLADATVAALATWNREPLFHISSPAAGWDGPAPNRHHDYIDPNDIPPIWQAFAVPVTIDIEAKAKEAAILPLLREPWPPGVPVGG